MLSCMRQAPQPAAGDAAVPDAGRLDERRLGVATVRRRVGSGVAVLTLRGLGIRLVGLVGNVVLARLLTPSDFGTVAVGSAVITFVGLVSDGGLGAALIRGDHHPSRRAFEQLLGLQLLVSLVLTAAAFAVAPVFGRTGWVVACMTSTCCVAVFGTSSSIDLERNLMFRRLATCDVVGSVAYLGWAIVAAVLGAGAWALASAKIFQVVVGTIVVVWLAHVRVVRPRPGLDAIRALLPFGVRFQAISAVNLVRDAGMNVAIAAVAGISTLGVWTMAFRFIQVPFLLFESLWRVTFPGMARLIEAGEDPRPVADRLLTASSVATAAIMCTLVGGLPALVPLLFRHEWHGLVDIIPWACAGLLVGGPISVSVAGLLFAHGDAGTVLRGAILHTAASFAVGLSLLPVIGVTALGLSVLASALVEGAVLGRRAAKRYGIDVIRPLAGPTSAGLAAGAAAWLAADRIGPLALGAAAGATIGLLGFAALFTALDRRAAFDTATVVRSAVRSAVAGA
jgi:O-antigen/teichoic acid export membrane protein